MSAIQLGSDMELNDSEKASALISLSNHAYEETKRYRDHVWKMVMWTIGLIVAVLTTTRTTPNLATTCLGKTIGSIFIVIVAGCGMWNIYFDYQQFVWNRNLLRACERLLQFYNNDAYGEGTLLPGSWKNADYQFNQCLLHLLQWLFVIAVVAVYSIYALIVFVNP